MALHSNHSACVHKADHTLPPEASTDWQSVVKHAWVAVVGKLPPRAAGRGWVAQGWAAEKGWAACSKAACKHSC